MMQNKPSTSWRGIPFLLLAVGLALGIPACPSLAAEHADDTAVDPVRDPRLAGRVYLRSEGQPVSRVLRQLGEKRGVTLTAGAAADERLIAFVPDASLAEVMASIADLYRLRWTRGSGSRPAYRLIKSPAAVRQETELRERCIREALQQISGEIEADERQPVQAEDETSRARAALRKYCLKLVKRNWSRLLDEGVVAVPAASLPRGDQGEIFSHLQPVLSAENESERRQWQAQLHQMREAGEEISEDFLKSEPSPPAPPRNCTFTLELRMQEGVELFAGMRDGKDQYRTYLLFQSKDEILQTSGVKLYSDRGLRPSAHAGGNGLGPAGQTPFDRPVTTDALDPKGRERWINGLEQLSRAAGAAVYSDDYPQEASERDRLIAAVAQGGPVAEALDRICGVSRARPPRSFWWRRSDAALIRSSRWLWTSQSVLPEAFVDQLAAQLQGKSGEERLGAGALSVLATLTARQAQGLFTIPTGMDAWRYGALAPVRFGPTARRLLFEEQGLRWTDLTPAEQSVLKTASPPPMDGATPAFFAVINGDVFRSDHDNGPAIQLEIKATWGSDHVYAGGQVALPERNRYGLLVLDPDQARPQPVRARRLVLALYYPWYGLPAKSGAYRHLEGVAPADQKIANFADYPSADPYDSTDETTIRRHLTELKSAGVDVLACSWWGPGSFEERAIQKLLPLAQDAGLQVCLFAEAYPELPVQPTVQRVASDLGTALGSLGQAPAYLKVQGRPVLFLQEELTHRLDLQGWADVLTALRKSLPGGALTVADGLKLTDALVFDGVRLGGISWSGAEPLEDFEGIRHQQRLVIGSVAAGIDVRHLTKNPAAFIDRGDGTFYRSTWRAALAKRPDWILVESFNHWQVGSEIEPSVQFGDRYLRLTAEEVQAFKKSPGLPPMPGEGG